MKLRLLGLGLLLGLVFIAVAGCKSSQTGTTGVTPSAAPTARPPAGRPAPAATAPSPEATPAEGKGTQVACACPKGCDCAHCTGKSTVCPCGSMDMEHMDHEHHEHGEGEATHG